MDEKKRDLKIGVMLKSLLKEHSLSMRKLSALTGIDTATISRIINGKQLARPKHLQQFAEFFGIPILNLFEVAGYDTGRQKVDLHLDLFNSVDSIHATISSSNSFVVHYTEEIVEQNLANYEHYARTEDGQRVILEGFQEKVRQVGGVGPFIDDLERMYEQFCRDSITITERAVVGSALLYFILATDVIPDYIFPIGYLDDAIAVKLVLDKLAQIKKTAKPKENDEN